MTTKRGGCYSCGSGYSPDCGGVRGTGQPERVGRCRNDAQTLQTNIRQAEKAHLREEGTPARLGAELVDRIVHNTDDSASAERLRHSTLMSSTVYMPPSERPAMADQAGQFIAVYLRPRLRSSACARHANVPGR